VKQVYMITYPTGKIYIGKDAVGSHRYFGSPSMELINADFEELPAEVRRDYTIRKTILWESETASDRELSMKEIEFIRMYRSNDPGVGYNRWPRAAPEETHNAHSRPSQSIRNDYDRRTPHCGSSTALEDE
jgi:hypothetical protein